MATNSSHSFIWLNGKRLPYREFSFFRVSHAKCRLSWHFESPISLCKTQQMIIVSVAIELCLVRLFVSKMPEHSLVWLVNFRMSKFSFSCILKSKGIACFDCCEDSVQSVRFGSVLLIGYCWKKPFSLYAKHLCKLFLNCLQHGWHNSSEKFRTKKVQTHTLLSNGHASF